MNAQSPVPPSEDGGADLSALGAIPLHVQIVLGAVTMPVAQVMALRRGAVLELDRRIGEPVDMVVNGRVLARGEIVVLDGDEARFGLSVTEIVGVTPASRA